MNEDRNKIIPDGNYVGYYWMSDSSEPELIGVGPESESSLARLQSAVGKTANPFVVEAQLYDEGYHLSVSVKYVDGKYIITRRQVQENLSDILKGKHDNISFRRYCSNRMSGRRLRFLQYWEERPDALCAGMDVLRPAEMVFIGFESETNK